MRPIIVSLTLPRPITVEPAVVSPKLISVNLVVPQSTGSSTGTTEDVMAEFIATESISIYDVVTADGKVASSNNLSHRAKVIGIAKSAVSIGFTGDAQIGGTIINPAWSFSAGQKLFLNGSTISSTPPSTGFIQCVGKALGTTKILIDIDEPITL